MNHRLVRFAESTLLMVALLFSASAIQAQTTQFTYQGRLNDNGLPATASYDFQFKLFDLDMGGSRAARCCRGCA